MAFIKRDVKDRVVQYPRRFQMVEVQPGIFDLIPVTGTVTEEGTPINKAYLQPIEDGLENALEKTGDGKDVTVTFTEAAIEAHILSGEKLSVLFGKILKKFKNVAPTSHAKNDNTYGLGSPTLHGHVKTINTLTQASHVDGTALSAYQGKLLNDKINSIGYVTGFYTGNGEPSRTISLGFTPKAVQLVLINSSTNTDSRYQNVLAVSGSDYLDRLLIVSGGFSVSSTFNGSGKEYNYIAFK